ncbi:unnamed protein product [Dicrocoelium dendriticum]|nr:unnamed protein product [Dicrocoelium dendriticum]
MPFFISLYAGGRRKQLPFRRQKVNIDTLVPEKKSDNSAYCCSIARLWHITNPTDPQEINLLDLATKRCEDLEKQLERLEEELTLNEKKIENFRHQVSLRDAEIDRLRTITEGGRPLEAVIQDSTERQADREIQRLQIQVDLLQARNAELESHFINTINKEPIEHCPPSQKISLAMCSVEVQTFSSVLPGQTDVSCQAVFPDHPCLSHIMYNMKHIQQLLNGIDNGRKLFIKRLDALANRGTKPITELTAKTAVSRTPRLHDREKHLEALKEAYGKHIQSLKNDCQYWRFEAHTVITALRQITEAFCNPQLITGLLETQPPPHPSHINGYLRDVARQATPCVPQRRTLTPPPHRIQSSAKCERRSASLDLSTEPESLSSELQSTQLERDHYRQLLDTARHSMRNSLQGRLKHLSLIQRNLGDSGDVSTEVSRLRQERDKLHSLMGKFERQLSDIQSNVRVLTLERNQLYEQLEQSRKELSSARDQLARLEDSRNQALRVTHCSLTPNTTSDHSQCVHSSPSSTRSMLLRLERDRDQLVDELRHMTSERDSLRDRLHDLTEKSLSEKARLLQRLDDAEKELNSHKQTPEDDALHSAEMTHRVNALEAERRELLDRIDCLEQSKANDHRLKTVERNLQTIQTRLNEVQMECEGLREEAVRLRRTIRQMDGEKDTLQAALDERTERCAALEREFAKVELQLHEYQKSSQTFEQRALRLSKSVVQKDAEFRELSERAAFLEVELKQAKEALGHANLETQQVKNDLGAAVNESQHLCTQLRMESEKLSDLQSRLDASNAELAVSKEMSSHTEQERINLLKQYRALTLELNDKADCVERLESQMRDVQHTCSIREQEAASLRRQVDAMRKEIADYQEVVGTLESQCALFSRAASESEERVRRLQAENEDVHREISDVRALCDHLEHQSRIHQQFVTTSNLETGQLKAQLAEAEREVCSLRKQVDHEIGTIRNLETILASTREEELKAQRNLQNYRMELQFTREKLEQRTRSLTETELEVHNLRSQLASLKMKLNWPRTGANRASRSYGDSFEPFMESKFSNTSCNPVILEENGVTGGEHLEEAPRPTDTGVSNSAALQDASSVDSLLTDSNTNGLDADLTEPNYSPLERELGRVACFVTFALQPASNCALSTGVPLSGNSHPPETHQSSRSISSETGFTTTDLTRTQQDGKDRSDSQDTITGLFLS